MISNSPIIETFRTAVQQVTGIKVAVSLLQHICEELLVRRSCVTVSIKPTLNNLVVHYIHDQAHFIGFSDHAETCLWVPVGLRLVLLTHPQNPTEIDKWAN